MTRVFSDEVIRRAQEPNLSPVVRTATYKDSETGSTVTVTHHEDGSLTLIGEHIVNTR